MTLPSRDEVSPVLRAGSRVVSVPPSPRHSFHGGLEEIKARGEKKISIHDFDGLDRAHFEPACYEMPMTEREFQQRLGRCTITVKVPPELR